MVSAKTAPAWQGFHVVKARRGYADTPMGQVHYASVGSGAPLVLLHQSPWCGVQYAKAQPLLAEGGLRAIAIDTPGFGRSDVPGSPPNVEDYADNLVPMLDALGLDRVAVLGHHTGASIATAFAARHPDRTGAVIVHGLPLYTAEERADRIAHQLHPDFTLAPDGSHMTARWQQIGKFVGAGATPESMQWSILNFLLAGDTEWYGHRAAFSFDLAAALPAIKAPTLIISNTADTIHASAARALKLRPDFRYHEIAGGTSHIMYDEPGPWSAAVLSFLREIRWV